MYKKSIKNLTVIILGFIFVYVPFVGASLNNFSEILDEYLEKNLESSNVIENTIKANSNTGGNRAESGTIINGKSESSLKVKTIINGEVVEDIDVVNKTDNEKQDVIYNSKIEVDDNKVKIETSKEINGVQESSSREFLIDDETKNEINNIEEDLQKINKGEKVEQNVLTIIEPEKNQENKTQVEQSEQIMENSLISKIINVILDIFKNNIDRIAKLF